MTDAWEAIRFVTMDDLVTMTKLSGSVLELTGHTTPEGWPFAVVVAVAKPGNERAVELLREFHAKMVAEVRRLRTALKPTDSTAPQRPR